MSVEIHFGADPSVTKHSPNTSRSQGFPGEPVGHEVGSDLCIHRSLIQGGDPPNPS
jgi:hypothetical protein